jgi:hypothetical protein
MAIKANGFQNFAIYMYNIFRFFFWKTQTYQMLPRHPEEQFKRCKETEVKPIFFL